MVSDLMTDVDIVRKMLSNLVLCMEAAAQLLTVLNARESGAEVPSSVDDSLLASEPDSDADSEDLVIAFTPTANGSGVASQTVQVPPTPSSTPTPADATAPPSPAVASIADTIAPPQAAAASAAVATAPGEQLTGHAVTAVSLDPTGPHHLWVGDGELTIDGRRQRIYRNVLFDIPHKETGQLYIVTRGRRVGIFASWAHTSPYVTGVLFAICSKVNTLDEGIARMMEAIDLKEARWLA